MKLSAAALAVIGLLGSARVAIAATIDVSSGSVSINGARPVRGPASVNVGDTVTTGPNGKARIVYANQCFVEIDPGQTVSVLSDDQCVTGTSAGTGLTPGGALAIGAAAVTGVVVLGVVIANANRKQSP